VIADQAIRAVSASRRDPGARTLGVIADIVAWSILCGSILWVAAVVASLVMTMRMASHERAGSEFIPLALSPLYVLAPLASITGAVAGFWLATRTSSAAGSILLYLVGGVLAVSALVSLFCAFLVWAALQMASAGRSRWSRRARRSRVIGQDEMLELINSRAIRSFTRESGVVSIEYVSSRDADGNFVWLPNRAAPDGFDAYVAAAQELAPGFIIAFSDQDSPLAKRCRWITADEAESLLARNMIATFNYGTHHTFQHAPAAGEPTGIKFIDWGWVRHIYVEPPMTDIMMPVARAAQRSHDGAPKFCRNGRYELIPHSA
jgi:hypothetical protein